MQCLAVQTVTDSSDWWWSTLASRPAVTLLALAVGCLAVMIYLGWRMRRVSVGQREAALSRRLTDDSGVATIEFVLVTPILLTVTLLLVQTMLVFTGLFYVQYAAYAGVRSAIVQVPMNDGEPPNAIMPVRGSRKWDAIESSSILALVPVCGQEDGSQGVAAGIVDGIRRVYQDQGRSEPAWVENLLAERISYAMNHTEVVLQRVVNEDGDSGVRFEDVGGFTAFSPKEAIAVEVRHEFALSVPLASKVFTFGSSRSGTYQPASRDSDSPGPPGHWTEIRARAVLTNEGIDRRLPDPPEVPRR